MKKFSLLLRMFVATCLCLWLLALAIPVLAQSPVTPKVYPLTNATTFTLTSNLAITNAATATINSAPFPIWRGRGFTFNASCIATDASSAAVTYTFQYATPTVTSGALATNWNTANKTVLSFPLNSTTRVFAITNIPNTQVDNLTLGRLATILNGHTNTINVDGTNTFISVIP